MKYALLTLLAVLGLVGQPAAGQTVRVTVDSVLILSDIHFAPVSYFPPDSAGDQLLDQLLKPLEEAPVAKWDSLLQAYGPYNGPSYYGSPTSNTLLLATLEAMRERYPNPRLIVINGDFLGHNLTQFGTRSPKSARYKVISKIYAYLAHKLETTFPKVVVLTCLGNNDTDKGKTYETNPPSPDFLQMYADTWAPLLYLSKPAEAKFKQEFVGAGKDLGLGLGHYTYQLPGSNNTVLMINSMLFWKDVPPSLTDKQLDWLKAKLDSATGKVWLGMHVPPGAEVFRTTWKKAEKGCPKEVEMMWDSVKAAQFFKITDAHSDRIRLMLAGHTHMDEFRVHTVGASQQPAPASFVHVTPSIGPRSKNNPGFQVLRYDTNTLLLRDFRTYYSECCSASPAGFCWVPQQEYAFNATYQQAPPLTAASLFSLQAAVADSSTARWKSYAFYYGVSSQVVTTRALAYHWYYWCGISARTAAEYQYCICHKGQPGPAASGKQARGPAARPAKVKVKTKAARSTR